MIKINIRPEKDPLLKLFKKNILSDAFLEENETENSNPNSEIKRKIKDRQVSEKQEFIINEFQNQETFRRWKLFFKICILLAFIALLVFSYFFFKISEKTTKDEMIAAEGVADVAMALTYAQANQANSLTQNWSNPEFLKNNFSAIVPPEYTFLGNIDSHGKFNNCPYLLRIYTNNNFSTFLVIALPEASLWQSLVPKNAIFIHSDNMELRKIEELKALNRLLVNPNTLDGANGSEIANLVKKGTLIPLAKLAADTKDLGFLPPKALALRRPGGENLVHNCPRYYQFSETYVRRALNLTKFSENPSHELARLQEEASHILKLPNLILYSSDGIESAIEAEKAFATFIPFGKFLNGYVIFNADGKISGSRLVMEEDYRNRQGVIKKEIEKNETETAHLPYFKDHEKPLTHPALFQISALAKNRSETLKPIAEEILELLNGQIEAYHPSFSEKLADLAIKFQQKDLEQKDKISNILEELYGNYLDLPLSQVLPHTKNAGFQYIIADMLNQQIELIEEYDLSQELVGAELQRLKKAATFKELSESTLKIANLLNLKLIPDPDKLISYQNETKFLITQRLEDFLLSYDFKIDIATFNEENRSLMLQVLNIPWIASEEEASFYLNEFDHLSQKLHLQQEVFKTGNSYVLRDSFDLK